MSDAPERIWVLRPDDWDIMIIEEPCDGWDGYIRADLFDAQARRIEELERDLARTSNLLFASVTALSKGTEGE